MTSSRQRVLACSINGRVVGQKVAPAGQYLVYTLDRKNDETQVVNILREIMDEDFADNTVRLDAMHSVIHEAKQQGILPLRTV